jgi:hypothetical protein
MNLRMRIVPNFGGPFFVGFANSLPLETYLAVRAREV